MVPQSLVAAWSIPDALGEHAIVLSFLRPFEETRCARTYPSRMVSAREVAQAIKPAADDMYVDICRQVGLATDRRGQTLRAALRGSGGCSDWWFHPFSSRYGPRGWPLFEWLVAVLTIDACATMHGLTAVSTVGAPQPVVAALRSKFRVHAARTTRTRSMTVACLRALEERVRLLASTLGILRLTPHGPGGERAESGPAVALASVWNQWVRWDAQRKCWTAGSFQQLSTMLSERGAAVMRCIWVPSLRMIREPAARNAFARGDAVALQTLLTWRDVCKQTLSFRGCLVYLRRVHGQRFRLIFRRSGLDLYPLFRGVVAAPFVDAHIPRGRLIALAVARMCDAFKPAVFVCDMEQLPPALAHYEGVRRSRHATVSCSLQHSANTNTRFYRTDPAVDFNGEPDGCPAPFADRVFVIGDEGFERFRAWGYRPEQLCRTGSMSFGHVSAMRERLCRRDPPRVAALTSPLRLLVVAPSGETELDVIEAACAAAEGLNGIEVWVRERPGVPITYFPRVKAIASRFRLTTGSQEEDIAMASVVLVTQSTFADQAFVCGVPTWRWLTFDTERSALPDTIGVPRFHSVAALRDALEAFARDPQGGRPDGQELDGVVRRMFGPSDGLEARRIVDEIWALARAPSMTVMS
jgi:hypothetical protein